MSLLETDYLVRQYESAWYDYGEACARLLPLMRELDRRGVNRRAIEDHIDLERIRARKDREHVQKS